MLYGRRRPEDLAFLGLTEADFPPVDVWPENAPIINILNAMRRQWHMLICGKGTVYTRMMYESLPAVTAALGITLDADGMKRLRLAEDAALQHLNSS